MGSLVAGVLVGSVDGVAEVSPVCVVVGSVGVVEVVPPVPVSVFFDWPQGREPVTPESEVAMNRSD
jgi:hypothetical protein